MRFKVTLDDRGGGTIRGPARYIASRRFKKLADSIENGTCQKFHGLPLDMPRERLIEQVLQTDFEEFIRLKTHG